MLAGAPHAEEGKIFLDWLFSEDGAKVLGPYIGIGAVPGYGKIDMDKVHLWKMRRPLDANAFKKKWASLYAKWA